MNNLMLNKSNTSKENAILADALADSRGTFSRSVEQLEGKQETDAQDDRENPSFSGGSTQGEEEDTQEAGSCEAVFYDGPKAVGHSDMELLGEARNTLEKINPKELSRLVVDLKSSSGILVDRKI